MTVSNCCGAPPTSNGDSDTEDIGICPECGEYCEYEEEEDDVIELREPVIKKAT